MSTSSTLSNVTVSAFGQDDMPLEQALDKVFNGLQGFLNDCHSATRTLAMVSEQDNDFEVCCKHSDEIEDSTDGMLDLFKELRNCVKQIRGKPITEEEKDWYRKHQAERKLEKIRQKEQEKQEQKEQEKAE